MCLEDKKVKNFKKYESQGVHILSLVYLYINLCIVFDTTDTQM